LIISFFILRRYSRRDGYSPAEIKNKSSEMVEPFLHLQGEMEKIERDIDNFFFHPKVVFKARWIFSSRIEKQIK
jgi:hypothetical protein